MADDDALAVRQYFLMFTWTTAIDIIPAMIVMIVCQSTACVDMHAPRSFTQKCYYAGRFHSFHTIDVRSQHIFSHSKISDLSTTTKKIVALAMATASGAPIIINSRDQKQLFRNLVPLLWGHSPYAVSSRTIFSDFASLCSYALIRSMDHDGSTVRTIISIFFTANWWRMRIITRYRMTAQRAQLSFYARKFRTHRFIIVHREGELLNCSLCHMINLSPHRSVHHLSLSSLCIPDQRIETNQQNESRFIHIIVHPISRTIHR